MRPPTRDVVFRAAAGPRSDPRLDRLLVVDPSTARWEHRHADDLVALLRPGDLLVVNDAATLPASLWARTASGECVEVRLAAEHGDATWDVVLLGPGTWRTPTEHRGPPGVVRTGERLEVDGGVNAEILAVPGPHRATVRFDRDAAALRRALRRVAHPVRYAYIGGPVPIDAYQTPVAGPPVAVEMPSAARSLTWARLLAMRRLGIRLASLTHAAGLSSVDGGTLDATLPWPERSRIPERTVAAVLQTRAGGGRVVAAGTTVVRALEGVVAQHGRLLAGDHVVDLVLGPETTPALVDGLLTTVHAPDESHFRLLHAFADPDLLLRSHADAASLGYLAHEFGDAVLVLPGALD